MFERFTDRARRVVVLAQEEARLLGHNYIGTEHILLALVHEHEGVAANALAASGVTLETARAAVAELVPRGEGQPSGHIPFTPGAKKVLELALRQALQLGHNYIGTEHVLLGLVQEGKGAGPRALRALGVSQEALEAQVMALLAGGAGSAGARGESVSTFRSIRFPALPDRPPTGSLEPELPVLRRLTPDAWRVLLLAESEALRLGRSGVGEEHVLLGVLAEREGRGARALAALGVTLGDAREAAERSLGRGEGGVGRTATLLPTAVEVIELALVEAVVAGRHDIDTEHILLGIVRRAEAGERLAGAALTVLGTTPDAVREAVAGLDAA
jgi:ATP-dependent Clp protease ATP-binding subunit ClpA